MKSLFAMMIFLWLLLNQVHLLSNMNWSKNSDGVQILVCFTYIISKCKSCLPCVVLSSRLHFGNTACCSVIRRNSGAHKVSKSGLKLCKIITDRGDDSCAWNRHFGPKYALNPMQSVSRLGNLATPIQRRRPEDPSTWFSFLEQLECVIKP